MTTPPSNDRKAGEISAALRRARQEEKLRENLRRRKDQARARREPGPIAGQEAPDDIGPGAEPGDIEGRCVVSPAFEQDEPAG